MRASSAEISLQPVHVEALHYLSVCNRFSDTPMATAKYLGLTKGTVSQTLSLLERKQLIEKIHDINDRRIVHLVLTRQGRTLVSRLVPSKMLKAAFKGLNRDQRLGLEKGMKAVLDKVHRATDSSRFGVCRDCRYNRQDSRGVYFCGLLQEKLTKGDIELVCKEFEAA